MTTTSNKTVPFVEQHAGQICGVLNCFDRVVLTGTIPDICHSAAVTGFVSSRGIRVFDFPKLADEWRGALRNNAEHLAKQNGLEIEFIRKNNFRKEQRVKEIVAKRGVHQGLVHIFSAMEVCHAFQPWHDKKSNRTYLRPDSGKCLHYYFYFIDPMLGLCYLRLPTWAPFRLQFYFNGHNALARQLTQENIGFRMEENAFVHIDDFARASALAMTWDVPRLQRHLDHLASVYCPIIQQFTSGYHWSVMQIEMATDIVFAKREDLGVLYEEMIRTAVHSVRCDSVATFLGRKLTSNYTGEVGNDFSTRIEGRRIRHTMGDASIKMYDKFGRVLRVETTCNNVTFFKHHRRVEHRDGSYEYKVAAVRKSIYSLPDLASIMKACNARYLDFLATITDPTPGVKALEKVTESVKEDARSWRGFNIFSHDDWSVFLSLVRGEFCIAGFDNRRLRGTLGNKSTGQVGRIIKRLLVHGLIRRVRGRYRYFLTVMGRALVVIALRLRQEIVLPGLMPRAQADS
jgi:hypothetical protein